jgi:protein TonB
MSGMDFQLGQGGRYIYMAGSSNRIRKLWNRFFKPDTQASLFHYIKEKPDESIWKDMDWNFLFHPIRTANDAWKRPRAKPSLFHYIEEEPKTPFSWKEFFRDLFTGFKNPLFITSVFSDPEGLLQEQAYGRTRKIEAGSLSVFAHILVAGIVIFALSQHGQVDLQNENIVFIDNPIYVPFEGDGLEGGGGGGGGRNEMLPPKTGRMPEPVARDMIVPDPDNPKPLLPADDLLAQVRIDMPINIPQDLSLPIGDVFAPPNSSTSFGPGSGGGIGTGSGSGVGSGRGPGVGPGEGGGMGGGSGGGIGSGEGIFVMGSGAKHPELIKEVKPPYTEEARQARAEGVILLTAIVRKNGSVDSFKVIRGLGYGLDESAIRTIASKWRFKPATYKGNPVDFQVDIEVAFSIY